MGSLPTQKCQTYPEVFPIRSREATAADELQRLAEMEAGSDMTKEAGRKRETHSGTEMAGGSRRTSRKITKTEYASVLDAMDAAMNQVLEEHMQGLVARWNAENPDATPLVVEALTEEQRESLEREHLAREVLIGQA